MWIKKEKAGIQIEFSFLKAVNDMSTITFDTYLMAKMLEAIKKVKKEEPVFTKEEVTENLISWSKSNIDLEEVSKAINSLVSMKFMSKKRSEDLTYSIRKSEKDEVMLPMELSLGRLMILKGVPKKAKAFYILLRNQEESPMLMTMQGLADRIGISGTDYQDVKNYLHEKKFVRTEVTEENNVTHTSYTLLK